MLVTRVQPQMGTQLMNLPLDIPWKLLGTSRDMMDLNPDQEIPPKWRSSLVIFHYEPTETPESLPGQKITYLKIVCSITGYQTDKVELPDYVELGNFETERLNELDRLNKYYPCYGALLQVAVYPSKKGDRDSLDKYPIIIEFEPKKRELYELVSDTGETLSGSTSKVGISKSFTTTDSTESTFGLNYSRSFQVGGGDAGGAVGAKDTLGAQFSNRVGLTNQDTRVTTIDHSREKRESHSHTTNLTQLYTLLQSYHVGTNRAVFLVLPRPHMVEETDKRTFINGPREIEGVQEFFLVVSRPPEVDGICVHSYLETGHLDMNAESVSSSLPMEKEDPWTYYLDAPRNITKGSWTKIDSAKTVSFQRSKVYHPPQGYEIDLDKGNQGYLVVDENGSAVPTYHSSKEGITVTAQVTTRYHAPWFKDNYETYEEVEGELLVFLKLKTEGRQQNVRNTFFITGRSVLACQNGQKITRPQFEIPEWVVGEYPVPIDPILIPRRDPRRIMRPSVRIQAVNELVRQIGHTMLESLHSKSRYNPGTVDFHMTQLVSDYMRGAVKKQALKKKFKDAEGIAENVKKQVVDSFGGDSTAADILAIAPAKLAKRTGLTREETLQLRWKLLGIKMKLARG